MELRQIFRYTGLASGIVSVLFIISGIIGYFTGEFFGVVNFSWFFWAANTFLLLAIFCVLVFIGCMINEKLEGDK